MKKLICLALAFALVFTVAVCASASGELVKVGIINNPSSESGYRAANVADLERVFNADNGYDAKTFYSKEIDEQLNAA